MSRPVRAIICLVPLLLLLVPAPDGLSIVAWRMFAFYLCAILGIVFNPVPDAAVLLIVLGAYSVCFSGIKVALAGYSNATTWLVFAAFLIGQAFIETGLGRRIAYHLINKFGHTTLGLGYAAAITDLAICPATPSNTARTGGIVYPIFRSLSVALGSEPDKNPRRIGSYITVLLYQISLCSGIIFLTGLASSTLVYSITVDILHLDFYWAKWVVAFCVPGLVALAIVPYAVYKIYPPELKTIDNKPIAEKGLAELGPMKLSEKLLLFFFVLAILGWATGSITKINATAIAIGFVALCLASGVMSWEKVAKQSSAWSTLIWYGGILGLAGGLVKEGFFKWLAEFIGTHLDLAGVNTWVVLGILLFFSIILRYIFASSAAYVAAILPVLYTIGLVAQLNPYLMFLVLGSSSAYASLVTNYSNACGPVLFGMGYVPQMTWWRIGTVIVVINVIVYIVIGLPYWKMLGYW